MRMTRGEWRGLLVLGAVLAFLLAVVAWRGHRGAGDAMPCYELPAALAARGDSATGTADSVAAQAVVGKSEKKPRKRGVRGYAGDRPSPLDR